MYRGIKTNNKLIIGNNDIRINKRIPYLHSFDKGGF